LILDEGNLSGGRFTDFFSLELKIISRVDGVIIFFDICLETVLFGLFDACQ
jgi:hypothetical protein